MAYIGRMAHHRTSTGKGPSQRQLRVGEAIRRAMSEALTRGEIHNDDLARLSITVGEVKVSADLRVATAYILPLGGAGADEALKALNRSRGEIRHVIARDVSLKFAPELRFMIDETFDRMDNMRRLFADERVQRDIAATKVDSQDDEDLA